MSNDIQLNNAAIEELLQKVGKDLEQGTQIELTCTNYNHTFTATTNSENVCPNCYHVVVLTQ